MMPQYNNTEQAKTIIFIHIPKAAGTTLNKIIEQQYEPASVFSIKGSNVHQSIEEFKGLPKAKIREIKLLKGHMRFGLHSYLHQPFTYITMLRDPIERIISHYYYVLEKKDHYLHNEVTSKQMSLKEYVSSGLTIEIDNGQTRLLSTTGASVGYGQCSEEMLENAKKNLREYFAIVGLVERFDETLILLKKKLGWKIPFYIQANKTKARPLKEEISADTLEVVRRYNELDIELLKYVEKMFDELINQPAYSLESEVRNFKVFNKVYSKAYPIYSNVVKKMRTL